MCVLNITVWREVFEKFLRTKLFLVKFQTFSLQSFTFPITFPRSFWCLAWKHTFYWLFQMYVYVHYKGLRWDFLRPKKVTNKVDAPKLVNVVAAALCPSISELWGRYSQRQMVSRLPRSPNISKCQVYDCH